MEVEAKVVCVGGGDDGGPNIIASECYFVG